jgi:hypothetical protein
MIKILRPDDVWQPKLGAPVGNRNARRAGPRDAQARELHRRIAALKRNAKALMSRVRRESKCRKAHQ